MSPDCRLVGCPNRVRARGAGRGGGRPLRPSTGLETLAGRPPRRVSRLRGCAASWPNRNGHPPGAIPLSPRTGRGRSSPPGSPAAGPTRPTRAAYARGRGRPLLNERLRLARSGHRFARTPLREKKKKHLFRARQGATRQAEGRLPRYGTDCERESSASPLAVNPCVAVRPRLAVLPERQVQASVSRPPSRPRSDVADAESVPCNHVRSDRNRSKHNSFGINRSDRNLAKRDFGRTRFCEGPSLAVSTCWGRTMRATVF